jgi:hypothetical protein
MFCLGYNFVEWEEDRGRSIISRVGFCYALRDWSSILYKRGTVGDVGYFLEWTMFYMENIHGRREHSWNKRLCDAIFYRHS